MEQDLTQQLLGERAKRLARENLEDHEIPLEMVLLQVAGEKYVLELTRLKAVLAAEIAPLPLVPSSVAGMMNVRGEIVSVLDLAALLRLERSSKEAVAVVLADTKYGAIGLRVEAIPELYQALPSQLMPALSGREAIKGIFQGSVAWLDVDVLCGGLDL